MQRAFCLFVLAFALIPAAHDAAAGEAEPWSQVVLGAPKLSDPMETQLVMIGIDDRRDFTPETFYQLTPGVHQFGIATTTRGTRGELAYLTISIDLQPCMTYELVARRMPATGSDNRHWQPQIKSMKKIKRCMKKFGIAPTEAEPPLTIAP